MNNYNKITKKHLRLQNSFFYTKKLFIVFFIVLFYNKISAQSFTSSTPVTNATYTIPAGITTVNIQIWGSGGSGGGCTTSGNSGSGAGGGGYCTKTIAVTAGDVITYTIGAGATAAAAGSNGNNGNATIANNITTGTLMTANGGTRGNANSTTGGTGGTTTGGTTNISGANGGAGGGNTGGNGGNGGNTTGTGGNGRSNANGFAGTEPGGGGGGGERNTTNVSGGAGANGRIIITCNPILTNFTTDSTICQGSSITITGTSLANATSVTIGGTTVSSITSNTDTQIVAVAGAGTTGTISVTTIAGTAISTGIVTINPRPTVPTNVLPSATTICNGASINLNATSAGNTIYWYTVASGGTSIGNSASGNNYTVTNVTTSTTYYAEASNVNGCNSTRVASGLVTVLAAINPTIEFTQGQNDTTYNLYNMCGTITGGGQNDIDIRSGDPGAGSTYQWQVSYDNGTTWVDGPGPTSVLRAYVLDPAFTIYETIAGTYKFRVIITKGGCSGVSNVATLITHLDSNLTPGSIAGNQYYCALSANPTPFTQTLAPVGGNGTITYKWQSSTDNINFTTIANATASTYDAPTITQTTYYRRVAVTSGCGATSNTVTVVVGAPTITLTGATSVCFNSNAQNTVLNYSATTGLPITYSISWNANPVNTFAAITNVPLPANSITIAVPANTAVGTYTGTITVTNPGGCTSSGFPFTLTVNALPVAPSITTNISSPICPGTSIALTSSTGVGYLWSTGATTSSINTSIAGDYSVKITDNNGCQSAFSTPTNVSIYDAPTAPIIDLVTQPTCSILVGSIHLENLPIGNWTINQYGTSTAIINGNNIENTVNNLFAGTYSFAVTNSNGCVSPASNVVNLTSSSTTWNGTSWSNGLPTIEKKIIFTGNYSSTGSISSCSCTINSGNIVFNSNDVLTVVNEINAFGGTLTFENNSSLIQINDVSNTGNITYKRIAQQKRLDYVYWSSPVDNYNISSHTSNGGKYTWNTTFLNSNGTQGNWETASNIMNAGKGYIVGGPSWFNNTSNQDLEVSFVGIPRNGNITTTLYRGSNNGNPSYLLPNGFIVTSLDDNWNLLGNPYPSAISARDFLTINNTVLTGAVYIWPHSNLPSALNSNPFYSSFVSNYNPNDYIPYNLTGSLINSNPDYYIGAGQGFFVIMSDGESGSGSVNFNNSLRNNSYGNITGTNFLRTNSNSTSTTESTEYNRIWLDIIKGTQTNRTLIGYVSGATMQNDNLYDATTKKDNTLKIFSLIDTDKYIIQGRSLPFDNTDQVKIGVDIYENSQYTIALSMADGLFLNPEQNIFLEDKYLNTIVDLKQAPYNFTSAIGTFEDRFVLRYDLAALGNTNSIETQTFASISNNTIQINSIIGIEQVDVFDINGKLVANFNIENSDNNLNEDFTFAKGVYIAKIKLSDGSLVSKKLIN